MASKRKKSKPTRITNADVSGVGNELEGSSFSEEDTLTEIQRYIEEGSEDTPDCFERKFDQDQSADNNVECMPPLSDESSTQPDIPLDGERSFPQIFVNGHTHIPSNLKFHQLMKDELEPLKMVEDVAIPETMTGFYSPDELISFQQALPSKKLTRKRSKPVEDETPRYSCTMCKYVTNRSDHYKRHLMTHSADKPLKCTLCSYGTGRSDHYKRHLQRHGLSEHEIIATCFRNGLKLKNVGPVAQAFENNIRADKSKENLVKVSTPRREETNTVNRVDKKFKCNQCNYSTDKSSHLTRHQNSHLKSSLSRCEKCNKSFRAPYKIKDHNCTDRQGHKCPKCPKIFADRKTMMCHIVDIHHLPDGLTPVNASLSQIICIQEHSTAANEARIDSANSVFRQTKTGISLRNIAEASSLNTSLSDDIEDHKPMDLTVATRRRNGDVVSNLTEAKIRPGLLTNSNEDHISTGLLPEVPSDRGNMGCTKCGEWFNRLNEYSTHACVS